MPLILEQCSYGRGRRITSTVGSPAARPSFASCFYNPPNTFTTNPSFHAGVKVIT